VQFPVKGRPGITLADNCPSWVRTLLHRDEHGRLQGILYYYTEDTGLEKPGHINMLVKSVRQRRGIGTSLLEEAMRRWPVDLDQQNYTDAGRALVARVRRP
jgi:hypothetical protein